MEIVASKMEQYKEKHRSVVHNLAEFFDPDDPEYITLKELFLQRFKEHNFSFETEAQLNEEAKALDEILARIAALQKANKVLLYHRFFEIFVANTCQLSHEVCPSTQAHCRGKRRTWQT